MRTLHINTERGWRGGEQQMCYLLRDLVRRGEVVDAVCRTGQPLAAALRHAGVKVFELSPRGELDLCAAARVARRVVPRRYDIVHAHTAHAHTLGLLARLLAAPWMAHPPALVASRRVDFSLHKMPFRLSAVKYHLGTAMYLCVSSRVREVLLNDGLPREKLRVLRSAVDMERFEDVQPVAARREFGLSGSARLIVSVGALVAHKSHWHLVRAMKHVVERVPEAVCVIAGEGPTRSRLEALISELGLDARVILAGFRPDAPGLVRACEVFVICSDMEGLGSSVLEAMAMERPVVATAAGGIPEMVHHGRNGILVPRGDHAALARGIVELLEDGAKAKSLAEEGRRTVEAHFTTRRMTEQTLAAYRDVLRGRPRR